ncbi:hypothetical protein D3C87_750650 [compost metagenome]
MPADLVPALRIVWRLLSLGTVAILLLPFVVPQATLSGWIPACEWQLQGKACPLCGMTRAFYLLSDGDLAGALSANPMSLGLMLCLVVNLAVFLAVTLLKRKAAHATR